MEVQRVFTLEGYNVTVTVNDRKTVLSSFVRFSGLLHELGLSQHEAQVFSIQVELDSNPPKGSNFATTIVRRHVMLNLCHHDKPSLMAGKLHAILSRSWTKGRDFYDLAWYLAEPNKIEPNIDFLNAALEQSGWDGDLMTTRNWRTQLLKSLKTRNWQQARDDVAPFLERQNDLALVSYDTLRSLLLK